MATRTQTLSKLNPIKIKPFYFLSGRDNCYGAWGAVTYILNSPQLFVRQSKRYTQPLPCSAKLRSAKQSNPWIIT